MDFIKKAALVVGGVALAVKRPQLAFDLFKGTGKTGTKFLTYIRNPKAIEASARAAAQTAKYAGRNPRWAAASVFRNAAERQSRWLTNLKETGQMDAYKAASRWGRKAHVDPSQLRMIANRIQAGGAEKATTVGMHRGTSATQAAVSNMKTRATEGATTGRGVVDSAKTKGSEVVTTGRGLVDSAKTKGSEVVTTGRGAVESARDTVTQVRQDVGAALATPEGRRTALNYGSVAAAGIVAGRTLKKKGKGDSTNNGSQGA